VPSHDLAHYVAERHFGIRGGFFGNIAAGYSIEALSDKDVIGTLSPESLLAEVLARALGSVSTGACDLGQFDLLVSEELVRLGIQVPEDLSAAATAAALAEFTELLDRYASLGNGEALQLKFD
jgi:hypothetical protein